MKFSCLKRKNAKNTSTQILKYPREATPIPGPHLGRSELFNRSVSATTNERSPLLRRLFSLFSSSSSSVYSSRYSQSSRREKSSFFGAKIFLQSDLSSKKAAKREEFSVTFHKTTKTNSNAQISSHRLIFTLVLLVLIDCALNLLPPRRKNTCAFGGGLTRSFARGREERARYSQRRKNLN